MKNLIYLLLIGYVVTITSGCNFLNNDDDPVDPTPVELPAAVEDFIAQNYPSHYINSTDTEDLCDNTLVWEVELEDGPGPDVDLYFSLDGTFLFTETDITLMDLPEAVINAISTNFADYSINEQSIEQHDYPDGTIEFEVELIDNVTGDEEDAVFSASGELLCFEADHDDDDDGDDDGDDDDDDGDDDDGDDDGDDDDDDDEEEEEEDGDDDGDDDDDDDGDDDDGDDDDDDDDDDVNVPETVTNFIQDQYPGYIITSSEQEDICDDVLLYEVELEDGPGPDIDLYFNLDWVFQFSEVEISVDQLPAAVMDAIATNYAGYQIEEDDVEQLERPDGSLMYAVELESDNNDIEVIFYADGSVYCEDL